MNLQWATLPETTTTILGLIQVSGFFKTRKFKELGPLHGMWSSYIFTAAIEGRSSFFLVSRLIDFFIFLCNLKGCSPDEDMAKVPSLWPDLRRIWSVNQSITPWQLLPLSTSYNWGSFAESQVWQSTAQRSRGNKASADVERWEAVTFAVLQGSLYLRAPGKCVGMQKSCSHFLKKSDCPSIMKFWCKKEHGVFAQDPWP